tara:strand:- start:202 stop:873 length:672 start_codon:yes stop_codon:yes gene_type:complete
MALKAKGLSFRTANITPGIGQIKVFQLTGQRQLPVLIDEENIISNSSAIIKYLDKTYQKQQLIPENTKYGAQAILIEDWADTTLAKATKTELIKSASFNKELLQALLPSDMPPKIKNLANQLSCDAIKEVTQLINQEKSTRLLENLEKLSNLVKENQWIVGDSISVADIAIAAQLSLIKFPPSSGIHLSGKGCKGFNDNPKFIDLFQWRDDLDLKLMQADSTV